MAVGFDRFLRRAWLDRALDLAASGVHPDEGRDVLDHELEAEIQGAKSRRETANRLARLWLDPPKTLQLLRDRGVALRGRETDPLVLHWGMAMACYPFFTFVAETIGRQLRLSGVCDAALLRRRVASEYGERSTASRAAERTVQTMVEWDALSRAEDGSLREARVIPVSPEPSAWLAAATLHATAAISRSMDNLIGAPMLFPFTLSSFDAGDTAGQVELMRHGGHREMVVLASAM